MRSANARMPDLLDDVVERRWDHPFPRTGRSLYCSWKFYDDLGLHGAAKTEPAPLLRNVNAFGFLVSSLNHGWSPAVIRARHYAAVQENSKFSGLRAPATNPFFR